MAHTELGSKMSKFHDFDPYDMLLEITEQLRIVSVNFHELVKAHNHSQLRIHALERDVQIHQIEIHRLKGLPERRLRRE